MCDYFAYIQTHFKKFIQRSEHSDDAQRSKLIFL